MHKIYSSGREFLDDCQDILDKNPLETMFLGVNASAMPECDKNEFIVKAYDGGKTLLLLHHSTYPAVIFGDKELCAELASVVAQNEFCFDGLNGGTVLGDKFLCEYEKLKGGKHTRKLNMDIMFCRNLNNCDLSGVRQAVPNDVPHLISLIIDAFSEMVGEVVTQDDARNRVESSLENFALLEKDGEIVSIANCAQRGKLSRINCVYTLPQHRNCGYSCKVVSYVTKRALQNNLVPLLYVDKTNPISNHLYQKIGFEYASPQAQYVYSAE